MTKITQKINTIPAPTENNKFEIVSMLKEEFLVHADSESNTFYKALEEHRQSKDEALHGEEEHNEIKNKLEEISKINAVDSVLDQKILELQKIVDHHVSDEEGRILNVAKKILSYKEAWILKEQMHAYKEKMLNSLIMMEEKLT